MSEIYENIELPLRDITEELKGLNKQLEIMNETLLTGLICYNNFPTVSDSRDQARAYLANRKQ